MTAPDSPRGDARAGPARLGSILEKNLLAYAAAATAAGIGMLAFSLTAEAKIVYTPANQKLPFLTPLFIDLNHDGVNDFALYWWGAEQWSNFSVYPANLANPASGIIGYGKFNNFGRFRNASALHAGDRIGPGRRFRHGNARMAFFTQLSSYSFASGSWVNVTNRYLGFRFVVDGQAHYGWARLSVQGDGAVLTGYAYETTPNKSIPAGKEKGPGTNEPPSAAGAMHPATLGELARGVAASHPAK
jgi:hypothetical protein